MSLCHSLHSLACPLLSLSDQLQKEMRPQRLETHQHSIRDYSDLPGRMAEDQPNEANYGQKTCQCKWNWPLPTSKSFSWLPVKTNWLVGVSNNNMQ